MCSQDKLSTRAGEGINSLVMADSAEKGTKRTWLDSATYNSSDDQIGEVELILYSSSFSHVIGLKAFKP